MKHYLGLGLAMLAGTFIGAAGVSALNAQGKGTVYLVTEIDVTNPEAYGTEFAPKAQASIKAAGGRQIAIGGTGGAGAKQVTALEGPAPKRAVIQQWDSVDALMKWYKGEEYRSALEIGKKYATFRRYIVEGM